MGLTNIYAKFLVLLLLFPALAYGQANTTTIPGKLKVKIVPNDAAAGDSALTIDVSGNVKKMVISAGGGSAVGVNGLTGTTNIGLGGTLSQNTTETLNSFTFNINQTSPLDIMFFKSSGTPVSRINGSGEFLGGGVGNYADARNSNIRTTANGSIITRDIADSHTNLTISSTNHLANGLIANMQNYYRSSWFVGTDGDIQHSPTVAAFGGHGYGSFMLGHVKATANGDLLIGMNVEPDFGTSVISGTNTLVGGSGYPNGTQYATFTGGTGVDAVAQATVSGGVVTSYTMVDGGLNYTVGDVLTFVMENSSGVPVGSGGTITVSSITSYTGVQQVVARFRNAPIVLDVVTTPTTFMDGMIWQDGTHLNARVNGVTYQLERQTISSSFSSGASATTTFTVPIPTQVNNAYKVQVTPTSATAVGGFYITNKTTTTFQIVYPSGLSGTVSWDWTILR